MDIRKIVGGNVVRIRREKGLTQEEVVARLDGFSQQYLSDLERGKRNPTIVTLEQLARALDVSPIDLIVDNEQSGAPSA